MDYKIADMSTSAFKYNSRVISGPNARYPNTSMDISCESSISNNYWNHWRGNSNRTVENRFFRKPRISIDKLKAYGPEPITISGGNHKNEVFEGLVWSLPIYNKDWKIFSNDASKCQIRIDVMENKTSKYGGWVPLVWLRGNQPPTTCNVGISLPGRKEIREEYADELPFAYICACVISNTTSLPKDGMDEVLFLFTFREAQAVYIIPGSSITQDQFTKFSLSFHRKYDVSIKFHSNEYNDASGKRFILFAKSWDDVRFYSRFSEQVHKYCHCRRCPCRED